jgi:hypothetical protein
MKFLGNPEVGGDFNIICCRNAVALLVFHFGVDSD